MDRRLETDGVEVTAVHCGRRLRFGLPSRRILLWIPPLLYTGVFFFLPLVAILRLGWKAALGAGFGVFSLGEAWGVTAFTLWQAALSTGLTLLVGLPCAYLFARCDFPGKGILRVLTTIPFILPTIVVAVGFNALLGPRGWVNLLLQDAGWTAQPVQFLHTLGAILLAHIFYNTSIVLRLVGNAWSRLDPRLPAAARTLGAGRWQAFRLVTLPLLAPSILAAAFLVFLFDLSSFGVILILGGPSFTTLEVEIYNQTLQQLNLPAAALLSAVQIALTLILAILSGRITERAEKAAPRASFRTAERPGSIGGRLAVAGGVVLLVLLLVLPMASPVARSFFPVLSIPDGQGQAAGGPTLAYYRELFTNRRETAFFATPAESARNSLAVAAASTALSLLLGIPVAAALARPKPSERLLEPLILLPLGTSSVTLGVGMLLLFSGPPFQLVRSPVLLPIAHSLVAFPFVVRSLRPAFAAIPQRLREAARTLGASPLQAWRAVDLPIGARAVASAAAFAFAISLGEFGATSLIARPDFPTMPVAIYRLLSQPGEVNYGQAMAMTTLLMILCGIAVALIEKNRPDEVMRVS
jgi:thiamine transport system permease protein